MKLRVIDYPKELEELRSLLYDCASQLLSTQKIKYMRSMSPNFGISWKLHHLGSHMHHPLLSLRLTEGYKVLIETYDRNVFEKVEIALRAYSVDQGRNIDLDVTFIHHDNDMQ